MNEKKAQYIIGGAWDFPRLGTDKQHAALVKKAKQFGYKSLPAFIADFKGRIDYLPDGNICSLTAHNFFNHIRRYKFKYQE